MPVWAKRARRPTIEIKEVDRPLPRVRRPDMRGPVRVARVPRRTSIHILRSRIDDIVGSRSAKDPPTKRPSTKDVPTGGKSTPGEPDAEPSA